ncbi:hypothetical protein ATE84_3917 [Aquimarina sp. MAR_2010_214]|nr:hypothetical protein ATE84_3917 [Aquimarina sp. MAR_2010_214]
MKKLYVFSKQYIEYKTQGGVRKQVFYSKIITLRFVQKQYLKIVTICQK